MLKNNKNNYEIICCVLRTVIEIRINAAYYTINIFNTDCNLMIAFDIVTIIIIRLVSGFSFYNMQQYTIYSMLQCILQRLRYVKWNNNGLFMAMLIIWNIQFYKNIADILKAQIRHKSANIGICIVFYLYCSFLFYKKMWIAHIFNGIKLVIIFDNARFYSSPDWNGKQNARHD